MPAKQIYFSNASFTNNQTIENMMIEVSERLALEVCIADFEKQSDADMGAMVVLCEGIDINEIKVLRRLEQLY